MSSQPQRLVLSFTGRGHCFYSTTSDCFLSRGTGWFDFIDPKLGLALSSCLPGDYRLQKGGVTVGMVTNIVPQFGLQVRLPFGAMGTVGLIDLADAYKPKPLAGFSKDQLLRSVEVSAGFDRAVPMLSQSARISLRCHPPASGVSFWRVKTGSGSCLCVRPGGKTSNLISTQHVWGLTANPAHN